MNEEKDSFRKKLLFLLCKVGGAFFVVLLWIPYQLYCIGLFVYLLPEEWRLARRYDALPKKIDFCRISEKRAKIHEAAELIRARRVQDGQAEPQGNWPAFIARWRNLIREYRSSFWKLGDAEELRLIREKLIDDIAQSPLGLLPRSSVFIWGIHGRSQRFIAYNPFTGATQGMPEDVPILQSFSGDPTGPNDEFFVYAVSVKIKEEKSEA